jgi:hypothetical protein
MTERGIALLVVGGLAALQVILAARSPFAGRSEAAVQLSYAIFPTFAPLFVVVAVSRIIANDRVNGYFHTIFAKPVNMVMFYAQAVLVRGIGTLACVAIVALAVRVGGVPVSVLHLVCYFAVVYIVVGGIVTLASALTSYDWSVTAVVWMATAILSKAYDESSGVMRLIMTLLPPLDKLSDLRASLFFGLALRPMSFVWPILYGLACLGIGLVVVRWQTGDGRIRTAHRHE